MAYSDHLFQLIKSLNQGEKWHFKAYTGKHANRDQKNYVRLFEVIEKQKSYDEAAIERHFKGEKFARHLSVTKSYLYNLILESLQVYDVKNSTEQKVRQMAHQVEILYRKNLRSQAKKLLRKAHKMAELHEIQIAKLDLARIEELLEVEGSSLDRQVGIIETLGKREDQTFEEYHNLRRYVRLVRSFYSMITHKGLPRNNNELKKFGKIFHHPLMKQEKLAKSVKARIYFHIIKGNYGLVNNDFKQAYEHYKTVIELMEAEPHKAAAREEDFLRVYIAQVHNFLSAAVSLKRFDNLYEEKMSYLRSFIDDPEYGKLPTPLLRTQVFVNYHNLQLRKFILTVNLTEGVKTIPQLEKELEKHIPHPAIQMALLLYVNVGLLYFCNGQFQRALNWFTRALDHPQGPTLQDTYGWVKILCVIAHLELGNEQVLEYYIKSAYRYWLKVSSLYPTEQVVLQFFRTELPKITDRRSLQTSLGKLHSKLIKLRNNAYEREIIDYFKIVPWLESQIQQRPMSEILKEADK